MIPTVGQIFYFLGYRFEVVERKANRLTQLRVTPM
jgi:Mg2+/Co2+ transporter CorB